MLRIVFENALYLLALLNPASKVLFLASCNPALTRQQNLELTWKSSGAAALILLTVTGVGHFVLNNIFHVELCALQLTGGAVLLVIGWRAIQEGHFSKNSKTSGHIDYTDISLVPLAAPLIAGPGMIAAVISGSVKDGFAITSLAMLIAIAINFVIMLFSRVINQVLQRTHLLGPVIRLTGLVIAAVAMQMVITGLRSVFP